MSKKIEPLVNLNVNPCKMCMPMGAVTALYGIKKCMSIMHGSQGCSTYIRRHMATHYNEPVDIASSSLTEHGTVYGGEENLSKGLLNLINLYKPEVIGVETTCLAETIGEDLNRIIENFRMSYPEHKDITIIPIPSPGYGGTQFEGYFRGLYQVVSTITMKVEKHEKINVITSPVSPIDAREIKKMFSDFGLDIILLPDISENLDGLFTDHYERLPSHGTSIEEIRTMAGAKMTIELCGLDMDYSPGKYLEETYQVPYTRLNMPIGLRDTDAFFDLLSKVSGMEIPLKYKEQRGRYLDAMVDSHKYNSDGRAVIFGEPDFVLSTVRLCVENGVLPLAAATGSVCTQLKNILDSEMKEIAKRYFEEEYKIVDDVDFVMIEDLVEKMHANIMIGNSDGRRIEEKLEIPLIRRGFPIHDRVGGQRLRMIGYDGSLSFLDEISNGLLSRKETGFRGELFEKYYLGSGIETKTEEESEVLLMENKTETETTKIAMEDTAVTYFTPFTKEEIDEKTKSHPCYNCGAHEHARIHLPVAPRCNVQCNYCVRKFDCPNESRPGVTTKVLTPKEALEKYKVVKEKVPNLTVVGIAGPGDALANFEDTKETLELIREFDPDVTFCLSTNGLMLPMYVDELVALGVSHITVTVNAVDPEIGGKVYKYVEYMGKRYEGTTAGALIMANQIAGLRGLTSKGIICKVNIVTLKGINDHHIPEVVKTMKSIGVFITNIMPMIPVKGSAFEELIPANNKEITKLREACNEIMPQMYHCRQCRADAIGTLDNDISIEFTKKVEEEKPQEKAYRFATATKSGMLIDQHFGHATEFYIYEVVENQPKFLEKRVVEKYCQGVEFCDSKEDKIDKMIHTISDCDGVIAMRIGSSPQTKLEEKGIKVFSTYDRIEDAIKEAVSKMAS